jgi:hypothetical protein
LSFYLWKETGFEERKRVAAGIGIVLVLVEV